MTQRNIDVMDIIVSKMAEGTKLSKALNLVYITRNVGIPYNEESFNTRLVALKMSARTTNALLRAKIQTIKDVVDFCEKKKITDVLNLGKTSGVELFETILDYCWGRMTYDEKVSFLIDTVERNQNYIREEIA